jgi:hypothetical protein
MALKNRKILKLFSNQVYNNSPLPHQILVLNPFHDNILGEKNGHAPASVLGSQNGSMSSTSQWEKTSCGMARPLVCFLKG